MSHNENNGGSVWRKWDLHIHTPGTKLADNYGKIKDSEDSWDKFCEKIETSDVSVFGITDYFSFSCYQKMLTKFKKKYPNSNKKFLPNIEFRIDSKNGNNDNIQLHVIFSNKPEVIEKLNNFFTRLPLISTDNLDLTNKYCTESDLQEVKYKKAMVTPSALTTQLEKDFPKEEYLIIGVANGYGSLRPQDNNGKSAEIAKELDKKCDAFFGMADNTNFYLNKKNGRTQYQLPPKAIIQGCDAHSFKDIDKKLGKVFTWIKADLTFEGLRQIIYEPEDRVRIQDNNPSFEFSKPFFSEIKINQAVPIFENENVTFQKNESIPLNQDLVAFIGGRGEGKSLFLNYLGSRFGKNQDDKPAFTTDENFIVIHQKENPGRGETAEFEGMDNELDFTFIEQSKIKDITEKNGLKEEIKKLLGLEHLKFDENLNDEISKILSEKKEQSSWFEQTDEYNQHINKRGHHEQIKDNNKKLFKTIETEENKSKLEEYTQNIKDFQTLKSGLNLIETFEKKLEIYKEELDKDIQDINRWFKNKDLQLEEIDFIDLLNKTKQQKEYLGNRRTEREITNETIKRGFEQSGFSGDLSALLENVANYQKNIEQAEQKIKEIEKKETNLKNIKIKRKGLGEKIKQEYERQQKALSNKWNNILQNRSEEQKMLIEEIILTSDINLEVDIKFNEHKFYELIHAGVDKRTYKNISHLKKEFKISNFDDWIYFFTSDGFDEKLDKEFPYFLEKIIFQLNIRSQYITVLPELTYKSKTIDKLSAGEKGTLYLRLQLATKVFSAPIIFDQPEDDLDNKFIIDELVPLLKQLKKYRQIIIATHNANLVISADAEQIIVAENQDGKLCYKSGSIENKEIKNKICEILEGGKSAFEKRKKKYNF